MRCSSAFAGSSPRASSPTSRWRSPPSTRGTACPSRCARCPGATSPARVELIFAVSTLSGVRHEQGYGSEERDEEETPEVPGREASREAREEGGPRRVTESHVDADLGGRRRLPDRHQGDSLSGRGPRAYRCDAG